MPFIASQIVEICIFRIENNQPKYLLLHRSKEEKIYPDIWQFVTGSMEGKETAVDAALREVKEETGFIPRALWTVPYVNMFYDAGWDAVDLFPLFAMEVGTGMNPTLSPEHSEFGWFPFSEAIQKLVWPGQREGMRIVQEYIVGGEQAVILTRIPLSNTKSAE
jgi:dATP pyrophosphohydrolase